MKMVDCIFGHVNKTISLIAAISGGTFVAIMVLLITSDVLGRYFLGKSTLIANEVSGYLLVALACIGFTWTQKRGKHIRVSVLTRRFPQRIRRCLSVVVFIVSIVFIGWLAWCTTIPVVKGYAMGIKSLTSLHTPMWIPYMFVPLGLCLLVIYLLGQLVRREALEWEL